MMTILIAEWWLYLPKRCLLVTEPQGKSVEHKTGKIKADQSALPGLWPGQDDDAAPSGRGFVEDIGDGLA